MSELQKDVLDILELMNIESHYPSYKENILKELTPEYCESLIQKTEELKLWIESLLSK